MEKIIVPVGKALLISFVLILAPYYFIKFVPPYVPWNLYPWFIHDYNTKEFLSIAYGFTNLLLLPFLQGSIVGREGQKLNTPALISAALLCLILIIDLLLAYIVIHEGIVCMIMASPLLLSMMGFGSLIAKKTKKIKDKTLQITIVPLVVAFVLYDTTKTPQPVQHYVQDEIVIHAPPEIVWKYLVSAPLDESPARYWLWKAGLPMPNQLALSKPEVGSTLEFRLSGGIQFVSEISNIVPEKELSFVVTGQADHPEVYGHISFDKGSFTLQDNGNNTTTLTATGWYSLLIRPASYFDLWMKDIIHNVHERVFENIARRAEEEWKLKKAAQLPL